MEVNLELYLVHLHAGQWFGFNKKEKTYSNLIILDSQYLKPSEQECLNGIEQMKLDLSMQVLRNKRNNLLAKTDWSALSDNTMSDAMKTYRQDLRDITAGLDTVDKVNAVVWPTKP